MEQDVFDDSKGIKDEERYVYCASEVVSSSALWLRVCLMQNALRDLVVDAKEILAAVGAKLADGAVVVVDDVGEYDAGVLFLGRRFSVCSDFFGRRGIFVGNCSDFLGRRFSVCSDFLGRRFVGTNGVFLGRHFGDNRSTFVGYRFSNRVVRGVNLLSCHFGKSTFPSNNLRHGPRRNPAAYVDVLGALA